MRIPCEMLLLSGVVHAAAGQVVINPSLCVKETATRPPVDVNHQADANGKFVRLSNATAGKPAVGSTYNFVDKANGQVIIMADPSVVELDGTYYITGTTDGWRLANPVNCTSYNYDPAVSNFAIYKTRDFDDFQFHAWAFPPTDCWHAYQRIRKLGTVGSPPKPRNFARLQSPQLFKNPADSSTVYMIFHATEEALVPESDADWSNPAVWPADPWNHSDIGADPSKLINTLWPDPTRNGRYFDPCTDNTYSDNAYWSPSQCDYESGDPAVVAKVQAFLQMSGACDQYGSIFSVSTPVATFKSPGSGAAFANPNPSWYGYQDSMGNTHFDGGSYAGHQVPSGGAASIANPRVPLGSPAHQLVRCGASMTYATQGSIGWMYNDAYMFFNGNTPYLFYGWIDGTCSASVEWYGNHIAYHKIVNAPGLYYFDMSYTTQGMAFDRSSLNPIVDAMGHSQYNGVIGRDGLPAPHVNPWGTAEGSAIFYWSTQNEGPGKYFAFYTRNHWDSPAYQIVYRVSDTLEGLSLGGTYYSVTVPETVWLRSDDLAVPRGNSYGHVDVFWVPWPKASGGGTAMHPYLTFHAKENGTETRHVYFKELRLTTLGSSQVEPVYEDLVPSTGRQIYQDASYFIMPRCPVAIPGGGGIGG